MTAVGSATAGSATGTLPNGVRYAVLHRPGAAVTTVSVWILAGSRQEPVPGVAHLLEHVVMQAVPAGHRGRVVDEIEAWGGDVNAMTTRDHVVLHAKVPTRDAGAALAVLAAAVATADFDDDLVEAERRVVQEELRLATADPTDVVHDVFFEAAYGDDPMGRPVGGTAAGIARLCAADLRDWSRRFVRPAMTGVVVCGGLAGDEVDGVLRKGPLFDLVPDRAGRPADSSPPVAAGRLDLAMVADTAAVVIGGQAFALSDRAILAAEIVLELIACGNASVLNEEIRSNRGLSYDIFGGVSGYRDTGTWRVAISTAPEHRAEVAELATSLVTDAIGAGWTTEEISSARRRVAGLAQVNAESSLEEALRFGDYAFVGGMAGFSLRGYLGQLASIRPEEVLAAARFMTERLVVATAGPASSGDLPVERQTHRKEVQVGPSPSVGAPA
jgi:predicted Zn-dependent peptidase